MTGSIPLWLILTNENTKVLSVELPAILVVKAWENVLQKTPALERNEPKSLVINSCCSSHFTDVSVLENTQQYYIKALSVWYVLQNNNSLKLFGKCYLL